VALASSSGPRKKVASFGEKSVHFHGSCVYTVSEKNDTALACYNFDTHQPILILFGRNVAKKVRSQMVLYLSTSPT